MAYILDPEIMNSTFFHLYFVLTAISCISTNDIGSKLFIQVVSHKKYNELLLAYIQLNKSDDLNSIIECDFLKF